MIKGKIKVSGGFRSENGGIRFGSIMSIIKTSRLREQNPFECIKLIFEGKSYLHKSIMLPPQKNEIGIFNFLVNYYFKG